MKIAVVGTGYVGLVVGTCLAEMGNDVICVDVKKERIEKLQQGIIPIFEPRLTDLVTENLQKKTLTFTTEIKPAIEKSKICFIAVGTPMGEDGSADLQYVLNVANEIGQYMISPMIIVDKSTVPVGTAEKVRAEIQKQLDARHLNLAFDVVSNPEFLKEGAACEDFLHPDRVVVGAENEKSFEIMHELYAPFILNENAFITMDTKSAELTKYAANKLRIYASMLVQMSTKFEKVSAQISESVTNSFIQAVVTAAVVFRKTFKR